MSNIILNTDSYKFSHWVQYPPETEAISSYIESRGGEEKSVFFGLQAFIKEYLLKPITMADIDKAEKLILAHGEPFNREGWEIIVNEYDGKLPVVIEAVPEGTYMETHNVQVQITNTDPRLFWLPSHLETALLRAIWYPSTVATKSRKLKVILAKYLRETSDVPVEEQIGFVLNDFGSRGTSSYDASALGGLAHLVNFMGTDNVPSLTAAIQFYGATGPVGYSIPAAEHATVTVWPSEEAAYNNMINQFAGEGKIYAVVSDSYDFYNAVKNIWGEQLRQKILDAGGRLVIRPDSGDPIVVPVDAIKILAEKFGYTVNSKGYKVLHPSVRVIQGDGINEETLPIILANIKKAGFSTENVVFGMGGGLLQAWNRDTLKYAMKASARLSNGVWYGFSKNPVTDPGKRSKEGRLGLVYEHGIGHARFRTLPKEIADHKGNLLQVVYKNGELLVETTFDQVRENAKVREHEYDESIFYRY